MSEENQALQRQLLHAKELESLQVCPIWVYSQYYLFKCPHSIGHQLIFCLVIMDFFQHFCHGYETLKGSLGLREPFYLV